MPCGVMVSGLNKMVVVVKVLMSSNDADACCFWPDFLP